MLQPFEINTQWLKCSSQLYDCFMIVFWEYTLKHITSSPFQQITVSLCEMIKLNTIKIQKFGDPPEIAVIIIKLVQCAKQSDLGLHCLPRPFCPKTDIFTILQI